MLTDYFDLGDEHAYALFAGARFPWEPLHRLKDFLRETIASRGPRVPIDLPGGAYVDANVFIGDGAHIDPGVYIGPNTVIEPGAEVRFGAYIRGDAYIAERAVVGHDSEVKHALLLPEAKAAHFAYVGDAILGRNVNLGAGVKMANVRVDRSRDGIKVRVNGEVHDTGLRKFGGVLGDGVSLGCNSVTSPGILIGKHTVGYPLASLQGVYPPNTILQMKQAIKQIPRR